MRKIIKFLGLALCTIIILSCFNMPRESIAAEMKIYFYLPDDWNSEKAYINYWNIPNDVEWPGYKMNFERQATGGKVYSYSLSNSVPPDSNIGIVFSVGDNSYQTVNIDKYTIENLNGKLIIPTEREYITSGNYSIECRIYTVNDPIGTTEPIEPEGPTEPIEPEEPTEPIEPEEPAYPIEPEEPIEPVEPEKPISPEESANPNNETKPSVTTNTTDSTVARTPKLPKAGTSNILVGIILIGICSSIYFGVKYYK